MDEITLNQEQKDKLKAFYLEWKKPESPSLTDLVKVNFPDKDGRSFEGKATKKALAEMDLKATPKTFEKKEKPPIIELNDSQKEFIRNNIYTMKSIDIARELFNNPSLSETSAEHRIVQAQQVVLAMTLPKGIAGILEDYKPPRKFSETLARINKYVPHKIEEAKMTPQQKKDVECCQNFLQGHRFNYTINSYTTQEDRDLFEAAYISYVYCKSDLSSEELDQCLNLSMDIQKLAQDMRALNQLNTLFMNAAQSSDGMSASKSIGDLIGKLNDEINSNKMRQEKIIKALQGTRSERMENRGPENASMTALMEYWRHEQTRMRLLKYAKLKEEAVGKEFDKIDDADALSASIWGIAREEIVPNRLVPEEGETDGE